MMEEEITFRKATNFIQTPLRLFLFLQKVGGIEYVVCICDRCNQDCMAVSSNQSLPGALEHVPKCSLLRFNLVMLEHERETDDAKSKDLLVAGAHAPGTIIWYITHCVRSVFVC